MTKQKNVEKWKLLRTCKHYLIVAKPIVSSLNWDVPSSLWEMKITITNMHHTNLRTGGCKNRNRACKKWTTELKHFMQSNKKMVEASKISWAASEIQIMSVVHPAIRDSHHRESLCWGHWKMMVNPPGRRMNYGSNLGTQNGMVSY